MEVKYATQDAQVQHTTIFPKNTCPGGEDPDRDDNPEPAYCDDGTIGRNHYLKRFVYDLSNSATRAQTNTYVTLPETLLDAWYLQGLTSYLVRDYQSTNYSAEANLDADGYNDYSYSRYRQKCYLIVCSGNQLHDESERMTGETFTIDYYTHDFDPELNPPTYECESAGTSPAYDHVDYDYQIKSSAYGPCGFTGDGGAPAYLYDLPTVSYPRIPMPD